MNAICVTQKIWTFIQDVHVEFTSIESSELMPALVT